MTETQQRGPLTFGSLFAGIGGFDLGFERAGMVCKWQVEIDDYATRVLAKHWPHVHRERDIRQCGAHNLELVDVICGGFPCQDISYAGRGAGLAGERSGLFFEAIRVVRQLQPRIIVLENVAALLTRGMDRVLGELAEIGFDAEWHCIPAAAVGAPHIRDRVFVLGWNTDGKHDCQIKPWRDKNSISSGTRNRETCGTDGEEISKDIPDCIGSRLERRPVFSNYATAKLATFERSHREPGGQWATEPGVGRVADGVSNRVGRLRGLGNAVVPQVAEWIGRRIVEAIEGGDK